jgi:hypothetical protein
VWRGSPTAHPKSAIVNQMVDDGEECA